MADAPATQPNPLLHCRPLGYLHQIAGPEPLLKGCLDLLGGERQISTGCQYRLIEGKVMGSPVDQTGSNTFHSRF